MTGLFAAVPTPVHADGTVDVQTLDRVVDFLAERGVDGICIGGATGEYPHFEVAERRAVLERASARLPRELALLVGIGASSPRRVAELGRAAADAGARALLLPMPMFFRYQQHDLYEYCAHVVRTAGAPCLLYDLPDFTNPLEPGTALALLRDQELIVGLKDSSGKVENLDLFAAERGQHPWTLLVGDDRRLLQGLEAGWDGGISGVAGFCPELLVALCRSFDRARAEEALRLQRLIDELIAQLAILPVPWGVRAGLGARGIDTGPLPLPLSATRLQQVAAFQAWFRAWFETTGLASSSDS
jgi:4-hydroxy-tetrahydrodipicolinate synthase